MELLHVFTSTEYTVCHVISINHKLMCATSKLPPLPERF